MTRQTRQPRGEEDARDRRLLDRVGTRDRMAFEELYRRFYPQLTRYLTRLVRRPEMVEEVVNDTMLVVWQKADRFEGRSRVSTWITGIAYLKGIKALDRLRLMPEQQASSAIAIEELVEREDLIARLGLDDWLATGLDHLSVEQRSVVELTYVDGYSYLEIAEIMGCPVNTVKTRMFHARRHLSKLLPLLGEQKGIETADGTSGADERQVGRAHGAQNDTR